MEPWSQQPVLRSCALQRERDTSTKSTPAVTLRTTSCCLMKNRCSARGAPSAGFQPRAHARSPMFAGAFARGVYASTAEVVSHPPCQAENPCCAKTRRRPWSVNAGAQNHEVRVPAEAVSATACTYPLSLPVRELRMTIQTAASPKSVVSLPSVARSALPRACQLFAHRARKWDQEPSDLYNCAMKARAPARIHGAHEIAGQQSERTVWAAKVGGLSERAPPGPCHNKGGPKRFTPPRGWLDFSAEAGADCRTDAATEAAASPPVATRTPEGRRAEARRAGRQLKLLPLDCRQPWNYVCPRNALQGPSRHGMTWKKGKLLLARAPKEAREKFVS
jgi:hypothetical protein